MKTISKIVLLIMFSILSFSLQAQDHLYGIKAGINTSTINGLDGDSFTGYTFGGFYEIPLSKSISVVSETSYAFHGSKSKQKLIKDVKIHSIQMPVLFKYYILPYWGLELGPQFNVLLNGDGGSIPKKKYQIIDLGISVGMTMNISETLDLGIRYNHGLTDITMLEQKLNTRVTQLTLGIRL